MKDQMNAQEVSEKPRKSPWRFLFAALAVYGAAIWLERLWAGLLGLFAREITTLSTSEVVSVGVIGGADGPTSILVAAPVWAGYVLPTVLLIVGILGWIWLGKKIR